MSRARLLSYLADFWQTERGVVCGAHADVVALVDPPAVVTNIYTEPKGDGRVAAKYFSRPPVRAGLRRALGELTPFPDRPPPLLWERSSDRQDIIGSLDGLSALFTSPGTHDLLVNPQQRASLRPRREVIQQEPPGSERTP